MEQMKDIMSTMRAEAVGELSKFMGLLTSTEGIDHLREFFETSNKFIDLRKIMLKE